MKTIITAMATAPLLTTATTATAVSVGLGYSF